MAKHTIPKEIAGYEIIEILGEGGMSVVYTAMQEHPKRKVAIKVLRGGMYSPTAVKRFHQEVEILGKLDHTWIAKIYDAGVHDDGNGATPYYVMEHIESARELTDFLNEESMSRRDILKLFAMITSAVEHGHHRGIVHRDLKPGNILIDQKGEPKIIDFGVARSLDRTTVSEEAMTEAGRLVGTVQFMAPEQVDAKITDIDARCDVYALGAVVYQMLTKKLPRTLEGLPIYEAVRQICQEAPIKPSVYDDSLDSNLEAIIMMALETNRENRYQTAGALGRDVLRYLGNRTIKAKRATPVDHVKLFCMRQKKQLVICGLIAVAISVVVFVMLSLRNENNEKVDELEAEVKAVLKENEELKNASPVISPPQEEDLEIHPIFIFQNAPSEVVVSANGEMLAAIVDDEYVAKTIDGRSMALPAINVEPKDATIALSNNGNQLAILSQRTGRLVSLGQSTTPLQLTGQFSDITALAVGDTTVAVASEDMSLEIIGPRKKVRRATSISGEYKAISFGATDEQLLAATDNRIYFWRLSEFPKKPRQFPGVNNPCLIRSFNQRIVAVGVAGHIIVHEPTGNQLPVKPLQLESSIVQCALNIETTILGYISNGKAFKYSIDSGEHIEVTWMPEEPIGVAVDENDELVLWSATGKVYRKE